MPSPCTPASFRKAFSFAPNPLTVVVLLLLLSPVLVQAQGLLGIPPLSSFDKEVNVATRNLHISIPVYHKAGRGGMDISFSFECDNNIWYTKFYTGVGNVWTTTSGINGYGGCGFANHSTGQVLWSVDGTATYCIHRGSQYAYVFTDSSGTSHAFPYALWGARGCTSTLTDAADDGSGYSITLNQSSANLVTVTSVDGTIYTFNVGAPSLQQDRNGNVVSVNSWSSSGCLHGAAQCMITTDTFGMSPVVLSYLDLTTSGQPNYLTYTNPQGQSVDVIEYFEAVTIKTNFGCVGVKESGPLNTYLPSRLTFSDGSYYAITYEQTPGYPGYVTGRLASIQLPTGGTINYSYSAGYCNGTSGMNFDGTPGTLTKTSPDGTWTYAQAVAGWGSGNGIGVISTDPSGNQTYYTFMFGYPTYASHFGIPGDYEADRRVYQGSITGGTLLAEVQTCYNTYCASNCYRPITERKTTAIVGGLSAVSDVFYNSPYGLMTEDDEYDFNASVPTRKPFISYASLGNNILDRPASVTIKDGSNNPKSTVTYSYDQTAVTPSGAPQLVSMSGSRGNATTINNNGLTSTYTYLDTGNVQTENDVNGAQIGYTYGACGNSFLTAVVGPLGLSSSMAWNCTGAVMTSATDENGQTVTSVFNDPYFWRVNQTQDQLGNTTYMTYTSPTLYSASITFNGGGSIDNGVKILDSLGRGHLSQTQQAPGSSSYDSTEVDYSWASTGRQVKNILPFGASSPWQK